MLHAFSHNIFKKENIVLEKYETDRKFSSSHVSKDKNTCVFRPQHKG